MNKDGYYGDFESMAQEQAEYDKQMQREAEEDQYETEQTKNEIRNSLGFALSLTRQEPGLCLDEVAQIIKKQFDESEVRSLIASLEHKNGK
jgi:hypothetical protein